MRGEAGKSVHVNRSSPDAIAPRERGPSTVFGRLA